MAKRKRYCGNLWCRIVHALLTTPCEGDYYCRICGRVQR